MTIIDHWHKALNALPLIAILRGITPTESTDIAQVLADTGFRLIEVPLNSPSALKSIASIRRTVTDDVLVGAGTVLSAEQVADVQNAGGQLIIAPNFNPQIAEACRHESIVYCPGVTTPTEAFAALSAGAHALKLFPAEMISPAVVKAMRAVLPTGTTLLPVGGISPGNMQPYLNAGADGFGIGSALYKPGDNKTQTATNAQKFVEGYHLAAAPVYTPGQAHC